FSLRWYFGSETWMNATAICVIVALLTVAIATSVGVAAAHAIADGRGRVLRFVHMTLMLPLVVTTVILAIGIFFVFAKLKATVTGLVLANVMLGLPYVATSVVAGLQGFDMMQEMVARGLGMNRFPCLHGRLVAAPQPRHRTSCVWIVGVRIEQLLAADL